MSKRWSQVLLIGSVLVLVASLAFRWPPPILAVAPGSHVTCSAPLWDAGDVFSGQSRSHDFVIQNTGRTAVTVRSLSASCGCTTFSKTLAGQRVEAGELLTVPIIWNVSASPGKQHKLVSVHFEEWPKWSLPLTINGEVKAAYTLSPPQLSFGTIAADVVAVQTAVFALTVGAPTGRIVRAHCSHTGFSVAVEETEDAQRQQIVVRTVPPLNAGRVSTSVFLELEHGSLVLPVIAAVESKPPGPAEGN